MEPDDKMPSGTYEAMVIDSNAIEDGLSIEFLITTGDFKGAILKIRANGDDRDELDLLGLPAQIVVDPATGEPHVRWQ